MNGDMVLIICVMILALLYGGNPDLMDAFIAALTDTCLPGSQP